jgi:hypothetical protein
LEEKLMNKVVLVSAVLIQLALIGCGNKSNNAGVTPQACGAAGGSSPMCIPAPNANNAYSQPILTQAGTMSCVQTSTFQQYGQPVYQQDYQWDQQSQDPNQMQMQGQNQNPNQYQNQQYQGQDRHQMARTPGPAVECSTANPCQTGFCQPLQSAPAAGYCRAS